MIEINITITPFDSFINEYELNNIRFIKIDVEGSEYKVLRGMRQFIKNANPKPILFIEIGWGKAHPQWDEELREFDYLYEYGYRRLDLYNLKETTDQLFIPFQ